MTRALSIDPRLARLGGGCTIVLGLHYILIGVSYLMLPDGQRVVGVGEAAVYYSSYLQNPLPATMLYYETAIGSIFGILTVAAFSQLVRDQHEGWVRWIEPMASFGFIITSIGSFRGAVLFPMRAEAWMAGGASTRAAIGATRLTYDYHGWYGFGAVGIWVLIISLLAYRAGYFSKGLALVGGAAAVAYLLTTAGFMSNRVPILTAGAAVLGPVFLPIFYCWAGAWLYRAGTHSSLVGNP